MRLIRVKKHRGETATGLLIDFTHGGITGKLSVQAPSNWDTWTRQEKVTWVRQQALDSLPNSLYIEGGETVYPDTAAPEQATLDFENLPGWATWSGQEAEDWIEANVTNLASAKTAIKAMARAIVYLRDVVIER